MFKRLPFQPKIYRSRGRARARRRLAAQTLYAGNKTESVLARVSRITPEIRTKAVDRSASSARIVHPTEHA